MSLDFIGKVFIINLDRRVDRMKSMKNLMTELNITNWERFSAIKPRYSQINKESYSGYHKLMKLNKKYVKGSVGCKLSHLEVLKIAKARNYKNILILEDDVNFTGNLRHIEIGLREIENLNWDILYLGLNQAKYTPVSDLVFISKVISGLCTHAYIVKRKSYNKIINLLEESDKQIDITYKEAFYFQLNPYIIPNQFSQNNSFSDINNNFGF